MQQDHPKLPQDRLQTVQEQQKAAQETPKSDPRPPKTDPRAIQDRPKNNQESQEHPKSDPRPPKSEEVPKRGEYFSGFATPSSPSDSPSSQLPLGFGVSGGVPVILRIPHTTSIA